MIELRALTETRQFQEAVELQKTVWGFNDVELLPVRFFVVATKVGGQAFGAYDGQRMVGFLLAIPGLKPGGGSYLHSHMLGVLAEYRNKGVGRMLKLRQREDALARGIGLVEWTFDPLELKNAFFNMERLGRYRAALRGESVRHHHQPAAWRIAHGSLRGRMVARQPACGGGFGRAPRRRAAVLSS